MEKLSDVDDCSAVTHSKRCKMGDTDGDEADFFQTFEIVRLLNENAHQKTVFIHGRFGDSMDPAVLILEKTPFSEKSLPNLLKNETKMKRGMKNDIYQTMELYPQPEFNGIKTTLIYPATEKHLSKYAAQKSFMVNETPCDYEDVVVPYIESSSFSRQWVYNILDKKSEVDRILFEDPSPSTGFILVPDMKWDGKQIEDLYLVAFVQDRSLHCIRNLTSEHIPLLKNIRDTGLAVICEKYGIRKSSVRVYVHYLPSYYHLHVHYTHISYDAPGIVAGKAHLLDDVIDNLEILASFYQQKTMTYVLRETDELCQAFKNAGKLSSE